MRHIQLSLLNPEMNVMTLKMPGCRSEMDCVIHNRFTYFSGRELVVSQGELPIITNELEIEFCSLMSGLVLTDKTEEVTLLQQSVQRGVLPEITNLVTVESVDRYLFDHPLEPLLEQVLEKHGYYRVKDTVVPAITQTRTAMDFAGKRLADTVLKPVVNTAVDTSVQI